MGVAHLDRARVRIIGVCVVEVDEPLAGTDRRPEQELHLTALSRQVAEAALVVDLTLHAHMSPKRADAMLQVVTRAAQPDEIRFDVVPGLAPKFSVVSVNSAPQVTALTRLPGVL